MEGAIVPAPKVQSSRLESLPPELLTKILELLNDEESDSDADRRDIVRHTMCALCLTSKALNVAATPYLYSEIDTTLMHAHRDTRKVALTLASRPDLTKHIRLLRIQASMGITPIETETALLLKSAAMELCGGPIYDTLFYALSKGCRSAESLLLFQIAQNARCVFIRYFDETQEIRDEGSHEQIECFESGGHLTPVGQFCRYCPDFHEFFKCGLSRDWQGRGFIFEFGETRAQRNHP